MKSTFYLLVLIVFTGLSISSTAFPGSRGTVYSSRTPISKSSRTVAPFYSQDFSSGIDPSWSNIDSAGNGKLWEASNNTCANCDLFYVGSGFDSLSVQGTTAANGIIMFDSESTFGIGGEYGVLTTSAINCSAHPVVRLSFNELFIKYDDQFGTPAYLNTGRVYVSNDYQNWTLVHAADSGLAQDEATPNPNVIDLDITAIAGGRSTVYIRFSFTGDYSYWWFIDDLALTQPSAAEASVERVSTGFTGCALSTSEVVEMDIRNNGSSNITNFPVSYTVNGGSPVTETITASIAPNTTYTHYFAQQANLSSAGDYRIIASVSLPGDAVVQNNQDTTFTYSRTPALLPYANGFEPSDDYSAFTYVDGDGDGQVADINSNFVLSGTRCLRFPVPVNNYADNWVITSCINPNVVCPAYQLRFWYKSLLPFGTCALDVYTCFSNSPSDTLLKLAGPIVTNDSSYHEEVINFSPPAGGSLFIAFHQTGTNVQSTLRIDDISVDISVGVQEIEKEPAFICFPNPSTGYLSLQLKDEPKEAAIIHVFDLLGNLIYTSTVAAGEKNVQLDLHEFSVGLYAIQIISGDKISRRMITLAR